MRWYNKHNLLSKTLNSTAVNCRKTDKNERVENQLSGGRFMHKIPLGKMWNWIGKKTIFPSDHKSSLSTSCEREKNRIKLIFGSLRIPVSLCRYRRETLFYLLYLQISPFPPGERGSNTIYISPFPSGNMAGINSTHVTGLKKRWGCFSETILFQEPANSLFLSVLTEILVFNMHSNPMHGRNAVAGSLMLKISPKIGFSECLDGTILGRLVGTVGIFKNGLLYVGNLKRFHPK